MASKNDENFIVFCEEFRVFVEEHHYGSREIWISGEFIISGF